MTDTLAFIESRDERRRHQRLEALKTEAQQTGAVRRSAVKALREEYRVTYWWKDGRVIIERLR